jgi:hypothetical protein
VRPRVCPDNGDRLSTPARARHGRCPTGGKCFRSGSGLCCSGEQVGQQLPCYARLKKWRCSEPGRMFMCDSSGHLFVLYIIRGRCPLLFCYISPNRRRRCNWEQQLYKITPRRRSKLDCGGSSATPHALGIVAVCHVRKMPMLCYPSSFPYHPRCRCSSPGPGRWSRLLRWRHCTRTHPSAFEDVVVSFRRRRRLMLYSHLQAAHAVWVTIRFSSRTS